MDQHGGRLSHTGRWASLPDVPPSGWCLCCHVLTAFLRQTAGVAGGDAWTWPAMSAEVQSDPDAPSKVFEEVSGRALLLWFML